MSTNWLDHAVGWLSPQSGLRRTRARMALDMSRAYEGAKLGRRTSGWKTAGGSANAETQGALPYLRNRSRDLMRNNPYASRALNTLVARSIGTGILAKGPYGDEWKQWTKECDANGQLNLYGLQSLIGRTVYESGECLVRFRVRRPEDGMRVPLQLQVLEPDYLDSTRFGLSPTGNVIIGGIEFDVLGRRVAYWLFSQHPGEIARLPKFLLSKPVPAAEIIHVYEILRPGQVRGVPKLSSTIIKLMDFDGYEEAELVRKKIEACFSAFVTTSPEGITAGPQSTDPMTGKRLENLEPGLIEYLRPDETIEFGAPASAGGYGEYTQTQLHAIAAGAGVTYEQLTGDNSQTTFSSSRACMLEFRSLIEQWQELTFMPMLCEPVYRRWVQIAFIAGVVPKLDYTVDWTTPRWPWIDPLKDVQAEKEAMRAGIKSLPESIRQQGYDPDEVFAEMKWAQDELVRLDVVVDSNAKVAISGRPANPQDTAAAEDKAVPAKKP